MIEELQQALAEIDEQPAAPKEMNLSDDSSDDSSDDDDSDSSDDSDDGFLPPLFSFINVIACIGFCGGASCYFGAFGQLD